MATLRIPTAPVFKPLLAQARYKGAYGGRGSGKSHFFGELMVEECLMAPGTLAVCIREVQKSLMQSSKRLIESKIQQLGVGDQFNPARSHRHARRWFDHFSGHAGRHG
jgi:phage terminase large subunit